MLYIYIMYIYIYTYIYTHMFFSMLICFALQLRFHRVIPGFMAQVPWIFVG